MGLREAKIAYFSLLIHIKQLLLVTFFYTTAGIGSVTGWEGTEGQTDVIVMQIFDMNSHTRDLGMNSFHLCRSLKKVSFLNQVLPDVFWSFVEALSVC